MNRTCRAGVIVLLALALGAVHPARAAPPAELILWNTLGSQSSVLNSRVGPDLGFYTDADCIPQCDGPNVKGNPVYGPGKSGNAVTIGEGSYTGVDRVHTLVLRDAARYVNPERGTVEAWYKQVADAVPFEHGVYRVFGGAYGIEQDRFGFFAEPPDPFEGGPTRFQFVLEFGGTRTQVISVDDGELGYNISPYNNHWIHLAGVWDRAGIKGTSDRMRLYFNGVLVASTTAGGWGTAAPNVVDIAGGNDSEIAQKFFVDELKLWDGAKTDFANQLVVNTTRDELNADGDCSLREAIRAANRDDPVDGCPSGANLDTIVLGSGTYTLTRAGIGENEARFGDLDIIGDLTLQGAGAGSTIIDGNDLDRVIEIRPGGTVQITDLTIQGGRLEIEGSDGSDDFNGGGIMNHGALRLTRSTVRDNTVLNVFGGGGGIWNAGSLTMIRSTVQRNTTFSGFGGGGGIFNHGSATIHESTITQNVADQSTEFAGGGGLWNSGTMLITSSTLNDNHSDGEGGGIRNQGGPGAYPGGFLTIENSTISGNSAGEHYGGGGIWGTATVHSSSIVRNTMDGFEVEYGQVSLLNTILADNIDADGNRHDCTGELNSLGYNLIEEPEGCTIEGDLTGNLLGVDPRIGALGNNGGPTKTHVLESNSPAIDKGNPQNPGASESACPLTDQRGVSRPRDGDGNGLARCDIGAVERRAP
jgi:CSLREA domain-containing protein